MKNTITKVLFLGISILLLQGCGDNDSSSPSSNSPASQQSSSKYKILPLGASRVEGSKPKYESFRYELWKDLKENNLTFDFIGTQSDTADYPALNGEEFDKDHEGRAGWKSEQIMGGISGWLDVTGSPDIVLFSSPGGNDILDGNSYDDAINNINAIIDIIQAKNPDVTIIIEQPAPARSDTMNSALTEAFNKMQQDVPAIAQNQTTANSKVIAVDMFTGFKESMFADEVHYNSEGAAFIAAKYYEVLKDILK